jgi:hypothetical protein
MSGLHVFVVSDGDSLREQALWGCPHDVHHLPAYCRVSAGVDGGNAWRTGARTACHRPRSSAARSASILTSIIGLQTLWGTSCLCAST